MGLRDRLKRRLGRRAPEPAGEPSQKRPTQRGPIRSRIDFAEEQEVAQQPAKPPASAVLDEAFWDADAKLEALEEPQEPLDRYDEHPIQHLVSVTNPETDETISFTVAPGELVLDGADRAGLELPSSCRAGGCLTCSGKLVTGEVTLEEQFVLDEEHLAAGYLLLCGTRVLGPASFLSHQDQAID
jgi:ferredoxin